MSFPISAALLDAIVLSVVAQEPEGTYGYRSPNRSPHAGTERIHPVPVLRRLQKRSAAHGLRCALQLAATAVIIRSPPPGGRSLPPTRRSGAATVLPLTHFSERWNDL